MDKNTGGSAFPFSDMRYREGLPSYENCEQGMTLRDYFAAKAMQGLLSNSSTTGNEQLMLVRQGMATLADLCYIIADAMIAERSK